jgi:hypothetical protein
MRVRWIGLALALALVGAAAGYGIGVLMRTEPTTFASARPVPAQSPSIPVIPPASYAPDIDYPPLERDLDYKRHLIGVAGYQWEYDVPKGWVPEEVTEFFETRWRPESEPTVGGYSLRVKLVNEHQTPAEMVASKEAAVASIYDDVEVTTETEDVLAFTYRTSDSNRLRFNTFRWFTREGGTTAEFEMSVVGRDADQDGLEDLLDHVGASVDKLP